MKQLAVLSALALLASACTAQPITPTVPLSTAVVAPTVEVLPPTVGPSVPVSVTTFADIPGNLAKGEPAPDFTARVLDGSMFTLSGQRGSPVLLFPTVVGCGDCIFTMQQISAAYPDYRGWGIKVVILDLYPEDTPETWQPFADYIGEPEFMWGVVNSIDFAVQYQINSLGTTMLVDREGKKEVTNEQHPCTCSSKKNDSSWRLVGLWPGAFAPSHSDDADTGAGSPGG